MLCGHSTKYRYMIIYVKKHLLYRLYAETQLNTNKWLDALEHLKLVRALNWIQTYDWLDTSEHTCYRDSMRVKIIKQDTRTHIL